MPREFDGTGRYVVSMSQQELNERHDWILLAGLEPVQRRLQLQRQLAERFHRRRPRAPLDTADVGGGEAGSREIALRQAQLAAAGVDPIADGVCLRHDGTVARRHKPCDPADSVSSRGD